MIDAEKTGSLDCQCCIVEVPISAVARPSLMTNIGPISDAGLQELKANPTELKTVTSSYYVQNLRFASADRCACRT